MLLWMISLRLWILSLKGNYSVLNLGPVCSRFGVQMNDKKFIIVLIDRLKLKPRHDYSIILGDNNNHLYYVH